MQIVSSRLLGSLREPEEAGDGIIVVCVNRQLWRYRRRAADKRLAERQDDVRRLQQEANVSFALL